MNELLKVLDMSEDEQQIKALYKLGYTEYFVKRTCGRDGTKYECITGSLADLAFRLRDEVCSDIGKGWSNWEKALYEIWKYLLKPSCPECVEYNKQTQIDSKRWFAFMAKPIHWIIAALIAKETK